MFQFREEKMKTSGDIWERKRGKRKKGNSTEIYVNVN